MNTEKNGTDLSLSRKDLADIRRTVDAKYPDKSPPPRTLKERLQLQRLSRRYGNPEECLSP